MNQGIHGVDILLYLAGNAKVLYAKNRTHFHNIEVEDVSVAMLEFENGATGVIEASTCANPGFERRLEIIGTEGSVILVENRIEKLILGGETVISGSGEPIPCTASDPAAMGCELHVMQLQNFVSAVQNGSRLAVTAADGRRAVALIEEIYSFSGE
jgi:predicted dehydrogenase